MLTPGQVLHLTSDIAAIEPLRNRTRAIVIPADTSVCVVKYPCDEDDRMAEVLLDGKPVMLLGRDLHNRAREFKALTATASSGK